VVTRIATLDVLPGDAVSVECMFMCKVVSEREFHKRVEQQMVIYEIGLRAQ
jgi:hypothetical protein